MTRLTGTATAVLCAFALAIPAALGGGAAWYFGDREYQPGDVAESTTSVSWGHNSSLGRPENGPFLIYLAPADATVETWPGVPVDAMLVGIVEVQVGPFMGEDGELYGPHHAIARFEIPEVAPGDYQIAICNDPCSTSLGDIIGGWDLHVVAGSDGRSADEVAAEVRVALEFYPPWPRGAEIAKVPETVATVPTDVPQLREPDAAPAVIVDPPSDVVAPSAVPAQASPSGWAIGLLITSVVLLLILLMIPIVDGLRWLARRIVPIYGRGKEIL